MKVRAFLACRVPDDAARALSAMLAPVSAQFDGRSVRWVPPRNLHVTLRFFGAMDIDAAHALRAPLAAIGAQVSPIQGCVAGPLAFPSGKRARVLAFALDRVDGLADVAARVDGLIDEARDHPFDAHVTVARLKRPGRVMLARVLDALQCIEPTDIAVTFDRMSLFRSDTLPDGPRYTSLFDIPFSRPAAACRP